jgi:hypothetical protein
MVGRLLWKEFRESWLVVLIAFAAPVVTLRICDAVPFPMTPDTMDIFGYGGALISTAIVMLWAVRKGGRKREEGKSPLAHLPANPWLEQTISVLLPLAIAFFIGTWVGGHIPNHAPAKHAQQINDLRATLAAVYVPAAFAGCYLITVAMSVWAALLAGFAWAIVGLFWMSESSTDWYYASADKTWAPFLYRAVAAAVFCLALFLLLRGRQLRASSIIAVAMLATIMFGPMAYDQFIAPDQPERYGDVIRSSDRSLSLSLSDAGCLTWQDMRNGALVTRDSHGDMGLIGFDNAGCAYVVRQGIGSGRAGIIRWNGGARELLATIPAIEGTVLRSGSYGHGSISPDRRYLAFCLPSGLGEGMDVWIVNLRTGGAWVAFPNGSTDLGNARWLGNRLVLPDHDGVWTVDLITRKTGTLSIPGQDGG